MIARLRFVAAALLVAAAAAASSPAQAQSADDARAANLAQQGLELANAHKYLEAEVLFREAWRLKHSYDIAGNLGLCELNLHKYRQAAEHLAYAKRTFPAVGHQDLQGLMDKSVQEARAQVGAILVTVTPPGAHLFVDGVDMGAAPFEDPIFVDPGLHTFEARAAGIVSPSQPVSIDRGQSKNITLVCGDGASGTPLPPGGGDQPVTSGGPKLPIVIAGGAVAGLGIIGGVVFMLLSNGKSSDAQKLIPAATASPCPANGTGATGNCATLASDQQSRATFANVSLTSFIVGGVAAGATVGYIVLAPRGQPASTAARLTPVFGPHTGGAAVSLTW